MVVTISDSCAQNSPNDAAVATYVSRMNQMLIGVNGIKVKNFLRKDIAGKNCNLQLDIFEVNAANALLKEVHEEVLLLCLGSLENDHMFVVAFSVSATLQLTNSLEVLDDFIHVIPHHKGRC